MTFAQAQQHKVIFPHLEMGMGRKRTECILSNPFCQKISSQQFLFLRLV